MTLWACRGKKSRLNNEQKSDPVMQHNSLIGQRATLAPQRNRGLVWQENLMEPEPGVMFVLAFNPPDLQLRYSLKPINVNISWIWEIKDI